MLSFYTHKYRFPIDSQVRGRFLKTQIKVDQTSQSTINHTPNYLKFQVQVGKHYDIENLWTKLMHLSC